MVQGPGFDESARTITSFKYGVMLSDGWVIEQISREEAITMIKAIRRSAPTTRVSLVVAKVNTTTFEWEQV